MEKSGSGSPIYRYNTKEGQKFVPASGNSSYEEIEKHVEKHIGKVETVLHEVVSEFVHIDVLWVKPTHEKPFHTFVTSGMSDLPMNAPDGLEENCYSELCFSLPEDWAVTEDEFKEEKNYWPIRWLKYMARFPHEYKTWLWWGHSIPNGEPVKPFSETTLLNSMLLLPPVLFGQDFMELTLSDRTIHFFSLIPLYEEELELKMKKGTEALFDGFDKHKVNGILDLERTNTAKNKKRFGLF